MKRLLVCAWMDISAENEQDLRLARKMALSTLNGLSSSFPSLKIQEDPKGIWFFVDSMDYAIDLAETLLESLQGHYNIRVLMGIGDVDILNDIHEGRVLAQVQSVINKVAYNEIWLLETAFTVIDQDELSWEGIGRLEGSDGLSYMCYRLVQSNQCFLPTALKKAYTEDKLRLCFKGEEPDNFPRNAHIVFVGYSYDSELHEMVAKVQRATTNDRLWFVTSKLSNIERQQWLKAQRHLVISDTDTFRKALEIIDSNVSEEFNPNATLVLTDGVVQSSNSQLGLVGVALPKVPLARIIEGYSIELNEEGHWGYFKEGVVLRIQVGVDTQEVVALKDGCRWNSQVMKINQAYPLGRGGLLSATHRTYRFIADVGKPYLGLLLGPADQSVALKQGEKLELGRQPAGLGFVLPDRGGCDSIQWSDTPQGRASKDNALTLDRALTGRHHAVISAVSSSRFMISPLHDKLPTFLMSKGATHLKLINGNQMIKEEGLIVIGTNVLQISRSR